MLLDLLRRLLRRQAPASLPLHKPQELPDSDYFRALRAGTLTPALLIAHARWQVPRYPLFAAALMQEAGRRLPQSGEAHRELGLLHLRLRNRQSAAESFHLALLRDETDNAAWRGLAQARREQRRESDARYAEAQATAIETGRRPAGTDFPLSPPTHGDWPAWRDFLSHAEDDADPLSVEDVLHARQSASPAAGLALSVWLTRHARPRAGFQLARDIHRTETDNPAAAYALGLAHSALGQVAQAIALCRSALGRQGDDPDLLVLLADCLALTEDNAGALAFYARAVEKSPADAALLNNFGCTLTLLERFADALPPLRAALALRPSLQKARLNLAYALTYLGEHDEALALLDGLLAEEPEHFDAHWYRAQPLLARHDYAAGWQAYRYRFVSAARELPLVPMPCWAGQSLPDQSLLVVWEQGIGDEIMFAGCLAELQARVANVKLACSPRLATLFRRSFPEVDLVDPVAARDTIADYHVPLGDLPTLFRRDIAAFRENQRPYLIADPQLTAGFKAKLAALGPGRKVGIAWRGGAVTSRRQSRSIPLGSLAPILAVETCRFVSLQHGDCAEEIAAADVDLVHWPEAIADLDAYAALIASLDLVITVCSAPVHFAGGLGKPAWVLTPYASEWRYYAIDGHMPWYPSVSLFRQRESGEWDDVILDIAGHLSELPIATTDVNK